MIIKPKLKTPLELLLNSQTSLVEKNDVLPRVDAATILAKLTNAEEVLDLQTSLVALKTAMLSGDKTKLVEMLATHAILLDALSIRLLSDANACKSDKLTITVLELALKSFDTTRKTVMAANELITSPAPTVAVQINNA